MKNWPIYGFARFRESGAKQGTLRPSFWGMTVALSINRANYFSAEQSKS
jgi:hypothetical protein